MSMLKLEKGLKIFNLTGHVEDQRIAMDNLDLEIEEGECYYYEKKFYVNFLNPSKNPKGFIIID